MKIKEKHDKRFYVMTTENQLNEVKEASSFYGVSVSHFVRQCIWYGLSDYRVEKEICKNEE